MTDVAINAVTRRAQFTGNTGTGPFAFTFNILADADIVVYKNTTLLSLTSDYTISTNANGTGSVTLTGSNNGTALVAADVLTIIGGRDLARTTDFVTAGALLASSLNEQLDGLVVMVQQLDEKITRSVKASPGDVFTDLELPLKDTRKGKALGFHATSGDPEAVTFYNSPGDVRAAVEAASDSNVFTDSDHSKLNAIEDSATADQTASEILTKVKTVDGTGSGLDADLLDGQEGSYYTNYADTAVSNLVDSAPASLDTLNELAAALGDDANFSTTVTNSIATKLPLAGGTMTGNIVMSGTETVDGRDLSVDGAKLDGIEANATADQTAAEIRTLVESASDSNVFTDADHTKLNGIESNATADQTASEILTAVTTVDGVGSDLNADLLDNQHGSYYETNTANVTAAGALMDSEVANLAQVKAFDASDYATAAQGATADAAMPKAGGTFTGNVKIGFDPNPDFDADVSGAVNSADALDYTAIAQGSDNNEFDHLLGIEAPWTDTTIKHHYKVIKGSSTGALREALGTSGTDFGDLIVFGNVHDDGTNQNITTGMTIDGGNLRLIAQGEADHSATGNASMTIDAANIAVTGTVDGVDIAARDAVLTSTTTTANAAMPLSGGTFTGDISFEGATANDFETTVTVTDPTADRTITLPDQTGTAMLWQSAWPDDPTGGNSIAIGNNTLTNANSSAERNTVVGHEAANAITSGQRNTLIGDFAGAALTTASYCTAVGQAALYHNTTDDYSTAVGSGAGQGDFLNSGTYVGAFAGNYDFDHKDFQTAIGAYAMNDCEGDRATAVGYSAMSDGNHYRSTAVGAHALGRNSSSNPYYNTAVGGFSGDEIWSGDGNSLLGYLSDTYTWYNNYGVAVGYQAKTGSNGVSIGVNAGYSIANDSNYCCLLYTSPSPRDAQ